MNAQRSALVRLDDTSLTLADPAQDIRSRDVFDRSGQKIGSVYGYDPYWAPGYEYPGLPYYHHA